MNCANFIIPFENDKIAGNYLSEVHSGVKGIVKFCLLGSFTISLDGEQVVSLKGKDAQRLFAYLLLHPQQAHLRSYLVGLFWPDLPEVKTRRRLTRALSTIRSQPRLSSLLYADSHTIELSLSDQVWIDYYAFHQLVEPHLHNNPPQHEAADELAKAIELYQGHLLPGLYDDWLLPLQQRTEQLCRVALARLQSIHKSKGQYQSALTYALRLSQIDSFDEANQREIMRLYMALAEPQAAQKQYRTYCQNLRSEIGGEPETETQALFQQLEQHIVQNQLAQVHDVKGHLPQPPHPLPPLIYGDLSKLPLVGREAERQQLLTHLHMLFDDELAMSGIILVDGNAGVGKTRLVQAVMQDLAWRGAQVVWHDAVIDAPNMPYAPYVHVLEAGLTELQARQLANLIAPQWLQDLTQLLPCVEQWIANFQPSVERESLHLEELRFVEAYAQILITWSQLTPLILVFDNLAHWTADCLHVLNLLMHRVMEAPLILVGIYEKEVAREKQGIWEHIQRLVDIHLFTQMTVMPLTEQATAALIRTTLATVTPMPGFEARIYQETAGEPLVILELISALYREELLIYSEDSRWHTPLEEEGSMEMMLPDSSSLQSLFEKRFGGGSF